MAFRPDGDRPYPRQSNRPGWRPSVKEVLHIHDRREDLAVKLAVETVGNVSDAEMLRIEESITYMEELPQNHWQSDRKFHRAIRAASKLLHLCNIARAPVQPVESVLDIYRNHQRELYQIVARSFRATLNVEPQPGGPCFRLFMDVAINVLSEHF